MTRKDILISWLNDAYSMENSLIEVLEHQVGDAKDFPQVQAKLNQHLEQTRRHAEMVKGCVEGLGGDTSSIKSGLATIMGKVQGMSTGAAQDEMVKNALQDFGAESFEVASYTALVAAAQELGEQQIASTCQEILMQDQDMANWIEQNLPQLVQMTMNRMAAGTTS